MHEMCLNVKNIIIRTHLPHFPTDFEEVVRERPLPYYWQSALEESKKRDVKRISDKRLH